MKGLIVLVAETACGVVVGLVSEQAVDEGQQFSGDDNEGLFGSFPLTDFPMVEGPAIPGCASGRRRKPYTGPGEDL